MTMARSSDLMSRHDTALLVIDLQERLVPVMMNRERLLGNVSKLIRGARLLGLPVLVTEQYPQGLGATMPAVVAELSEGQVRWPKRAFSCAELTELFEPLRAAGRFRIVVAGIETHVCVQQTVLDLMHLGFRLYVAADAVSARQPLDHELALRRIESSGATLTTTEAALFEWCESSTAAEFKQLSSLVKETAS